ncbi:adenylate kinase [Mycoplasma phocoenae]|uniref:adenylate kinase n=1 Tax=Mycoplasma phocoenae TaxID=754517 RepID=UPI001F01EE81|nr:adenylate kinase [Mycoplasma phocoenae]
MIKNNQQLNLIFLGAPGAGKGTIAKELVKNNQYFQLSTGDMFREQIKAKTPLGLKVIDITSRGQYVSDDITNELVQNKLQTLTKDNQKYILDGYPRTIAQVEFLETLEFTKIDYVVLLEIEDQVIIDRISKRRVCPNCSATYHLESKPSKDGIHCDFDQTELIQRKDDQSDVVLDRLKVYNEQTKPLIDFYEQKGNLLRVNANQNINKVYNDVINALECVKN